MMPQGSIGGTHCSLQFTIAQAGVRLQGGQNSSPQGVFVVGCFGSDAPHCHGSNCAGSSRYPSSKASNTAGCSGQASSQPWSLPYPLGEKRHEVRFVFSFLKPSLI